MMSSITRVSQASSIPHIPREPFAPDMQRVGEILDIFENINEEDPYASGQHALIADFETYSAEVVEISKNLQKLRTEGYKPYDFSQWIQDRNNYIKRCDELMKSLSGQTCCLRSLRQELLNSANTFYDPEIDGTFEVILAMNEYPVV